MEYTSSNGKPLPGVEDHRPVFEVDEELAVEHEEELVVLIVFVPMVFAFDDSDAYDTVIHLRQCFIIPFVFDGLYHGRHVDEFKVVVFDVEDGGVRKFLGHLIYVNGANPWVIYFYIA